MLTLGHDLVFYDPRAHKLDAPEDYAKWDFGAVALCDAVFACMTLDNPSGYGMAAEIGFARGLGKRIVFVNYLRAGDQRQKHMLLIEELCDSVHDKLTDGAKALCKIARSHSR